MMHEETPSSTAYTVIHGILHTAQNPQLRYLVSDEVIEACTTILSASAEGKKRLAQLNNPIKKNMLPLLEWLLAPGITLNYVLRKRFIEEQVLKALEEGITQVINIGAGFDTLCWRLSRRFPETTFIEIDHPATSKEKTKAFFRNRHDVQNLHFIAADLAKEELESILPAFPSFRSEGKTVFICEGVLMYLQKEHVLSLFDTLKRTSGPGSRFIFSAMEPDGSQKNNVRPLLQYYLKMKNESYNWYIPATEMPAFLNTLGYRQIDSADAATYKERYLMKEHRGTLHQGEYITVSVIE